MKYEWDKAQRHTKVGIIAKLDKLLMTCINVNLKWKPFATELSVSELNIFFFLIGIMNKKNPQS